MQEENNKSLMEKISLPLSIIVAGALIAGGVYLNGKMEKDRELSAVEKAREGGLAGSSIERILRPLDENDHVLGSPSARIVIIEYSDTECPFCKTFHSTMNTIMQEYGNKAQVAWVYRHFPIAELHSKAPREAEALECVAELGGNSKFWEYINKLYEVTPSNNGLEDLELSKLAALVEIDKAKFTVCLNSGEFRTRVEADVQNAQELGALGTPFNILIDTKTGEHYPLEGAYPYNQLKQVIDLILES
ncbi:MAG: DsbA family protein [Patescibacteria group bacterium]